MVAAVPRRSRPGAFATPFARSHARLLLTYWYAPEIRRIVKMIRYQYHSDVHQEDDFELIRFKLN